jgi:hypothetical protein
VGTSNSDWPHGGDEPPRSGHCPDDRNDGDWSKASMASRYASAAYSPWFQLGLTRAEGALGCPVPTGADDTQGGTTGVGSRLSERVSSDHAGAASTVVNAGQQLGTAIDNALLNTIAISGAARQLAGPIPAGSRSGRCRGGRSRCPDRGEWSRRTEGYCRRSRRATGGPDHDDHSRQNRGEAYARVDAHRSSTPNSDQRNIVKRAITKLEGHPRRHVPRNPSTSPRSGSGSATLFHVSAPPVRGCGPTGRHRGGTARSVRSATSAPPRPHRRAHVLRAQPPLGSARSHPVSCLPPGVAVIPKPLQ